MPEGIDVEGQVADPDERAVPGRVAITPRGGRGRGRVSARARVRGPRVRFNDVVIHAETNPRGTRPGPRTAPGRRGRNPIESTVQDKGDESHTRRSPVPAYHRT